MLKLWLRCVQYCAVDPSGLGLNGKTIQSAGVGKPRGLNGEQTNRSLRALCARCFNLCARSCGCEVGLRSMMVLQISSAHPLETLHPVEEVPLHPLEELPVSSSSGGVA